MALKNGLEGVGLKSQRLFTAAKLNGHPLHSLTMKIVD